MVSEEPALLSSRQYVSSCVVIAASTVASGQSPLANGKLILSSKLVKILQFHGMHT
jgi:hypothetical protein